MRFLMLALIASASSVITSALSVAASAQLAPGYSGQPGWRQADESEYWWAVSTLGHCLYQSKKKDSLALLTSERGSRAEQASVKALVGKHTKCLQDLSRMGLGTVELRGTVAQAAYRATAKRSPAAASYQVPASLSRAEASRLGADKLMGQMASCVATRYPEPVHALLQTQLGSKLEATSMTGLREAISSCSPGRLRFELQQSEMRGLLAEAALRRVVQGGVQ